MGQRGGCSWCLPFRLAADGWIGWDAESTGLTNWLSSCSVSILYDLNRSRGLCASHPHVEALGIFQFLIAAQKRQAKFEFGSSLIRRICGSFSAGVALFVIKIYYNVSVLSCSFCLPGCTSSIQNSECFPLPWHV